MYAEYRTKLKIIITQSKLTIEINRQRQQTKQHRKKEATNTAR